MSNQDLYNSLYMLTKILYKTVHNMPKEYKFSLGQDIIRLCWECLDKYFETNSLPDEDKMPVIKKLSLCFDKLKTRMRMAEETGAISQAYFVHCQENYLFSIGERIGGWERWAGEILIGDEPKDSKCPIGHLESDTATILIK